MDQGDLEEFRQRLWREEMDRALARMAIEAYSSDGTVRLPVPGAEKLQEFLAALRPKVEERSGSPSVQRHMRRINEHVDAAYRVWTGPPIPSVESCLLRAAYEVTRATSRAYELGAILATLYRAHDLLSRAPQAGKWSLPGALHLAARSNRPARAGAQQIIGEALGVSPWELEAWNDAEGRTRGEVLLALDGAIRRLLDRVRGAPPQAVKPWSRQATRALAQFRLIPCSSAAGPSGRPSSG